MPLILVAVVAIAAGVWIFAKQPEQGVAGDPAAGRKVAQTWCASCHQVTPDQIRPQVQGPQPPPFATIAADRSKDETYLRGFLTELHLPMPTFRLTDDEKQDVIAYFHSLRR